MKKIILAFAESLLSKEQMKKVMGGCSGDPCGNNKCKCLVDDKMLDCGALISCVPSSGGPTYTLSRAQCGNSDCTCP